MTYRVELENGDAMTVEAGGFIGLTNGEAMPIEEVEVGMETWVGYYMPNAWTRNSPITRIDLVN